MRFRKPEKVFENIAEALVEFQCPCLCGDGCPIYKGGNCRDWVEKNPVEAARLMGYEVIEEETVERDLKITTENSTCCGTKDKPLKDWTLGEVKEFCLQQTKESEYDYETVCLHCKLNGVCSLNAEDWELEERPRLTPAELAICKAIPGVKWLSRDRNGGRSDFVYLWDARPADFRNHYMSNDMMLAYVTYKAFPSVQPGDLICVEEAEGDA